MKESLIQAYSNSPRRQKLQTIGSIFMVIVISAVMLILYLVVSARVVAMGRQVQIAKDEIDRLVYVSVNYRNVIKHSIGHFEETGNICAFHIVDMAIRLGTMFYAGSMNTGHDMMQAVVHLCPAPVDLHGVLGHFQPRGGHPTSIGGLPGSIEDLLILKFFEKIRNFLRPFEGL